MNESAILEGESSLLLWALAALVAALAGHVALGWVRAAQQNATRHARWPSVLVAAATLGTGLCGAVVLALSAEALSFPLGYHALSSALLWLGAVALCLPLLAWLAYSPNQLAVFGGSVLLAAGITALQMGWITAAGFRPGLRWKSVYVAAAVMAEIVGFAIVLWLNFEQNRLEARRRTATQLGAAAALAFTLLAAQQLLTMGAGLTTQKGSVYLREMPAAILVLVSAVLVPLVLLVMALELATRRRSRRRRSRHRSRKP